MSKSDSDIPIVWFLLADIILVIGAVLVGYASCMIQQGFGPSFFLKTVKCLL